eukprot:gnl/TRDRNA2_/TRDRNA2_186371_c0_seq1.p1 gnl/TRDRNA2_/TRDRNA2_186371_c0~~gnl/TRDRNA2_/TRDRNA2_186371_c0_seq1.p1  ORF type:complete len:380 (+),score=87.73 gnl/TRDRNA2_/TRDRNA2_186371_c0_seq1:47-1141(+)
MAAAAGGVSRFLQASASLSDTELAAGLQALLARRPAVKQALLSVWSAEDAIGGVQARVEMQAAVPTEAPLESQAATPFPGLRAAASVPGPVARLRVATARLAAHSSAKAIGTDHVLAAAVALFPQESSSVLGHALHIQLVDLLEKSRLVAPPADYDGPSGESLEVKPKAEALLSRMEAGEKGIGIAAVFEELLNLPDADAVAQLLEMARVYAANADPPEPPAAVSKAPAAATQADGASVLDRLKKRARQYATFYESDEIGTEHILAAAVEMFATDATASLGASWFEQLGLLLEKSQLAPPPANTSASSRLSFGEDTEQLLAAVNPGSCEGQAALFRAILALPDNASATQLLEMAKIFAERAPYA